MFIVFCKSIQSPIQSINQFFLNLALFSREKIQPSSNGRVSFPAPNQLSIKFVNQYDAGVYSCKVANNAGVSQRDVEVFIISKST